MTTMEQVVLDALKGLEKPHHASTLANDVVVHLNGHKPTFVHGDGRFINPTTIITMPDGDTSMFCALNYQEKRMVLDANRLGGGRWLTNGSFTLFKKDMERS